MFDIDFIKKGNYLVHIRKFLLLPEFWRNSDNQIDNKLQWKSIKFNVNNVTKIPEEKGIYCFIVRPNYPNFFTTTYLFYVGKTTRTLRKRYKEYLEDQKGKGKPRPKVFEMLELYKNDLYFYYTTIKLNDRIDNCEVNILNTFVPHINTSIPKAKFNPELKNIYEN